MNNGTGPPMCATELVLDQHGLYCDFPVRTLVGGVKGQSR